MDTIDVIVIGSGIAGLSAALSATENGAGSVAILEADTEIGGSSRLSGGVVMGADYQLQRTAGIQDSAEDFYRDYMNANVWNVNPAAAKAYCHESGPTIDWLVEHGVEFHRDLTFAGSENTPRSVSAIGQGQQMVTSLARQARALGVDIAVNHRVERILVESGRAVGVVVDGEEIQANAVVIASGGYGANKEFLAEHNPSWTATGPWGWYIGAGTARGDALRFAERLGARIDGHDRGLRLLHPDFVHTFENYLPGWMVLVNKDGRRFVDESSPYGVLDRATHRNGGVAWLVFDHQALDRSTANNTKDYKQILPEREGRQSPNWNPAMITEQVEAGRIHTANTIAELAELAGLPADQLQATVVTYNDGNHDDQGKDRQFVRPITRGPFYTAEVRLATLCWTGVGPAISERSEILDMLGRPIPGAYACGEVTGGVLGDMYVGSGNAIGIAATFGRIAGRSAAQDIARLSPATD